MAKVAGDVVMRIGGDNSGFTRVLSDSSSKLDAFRSNINSGAKSLAKFSAAAGVAGAALAVAITRDAAQAGKEISNLSRVSGVSTTQFQKMAAATQTVGIEQDKLADIFKDVRDRVGDFIQTGGGPMADFFERIAPKVGVTAEQFRKLSGPQALQLFVDSMEKAGLSSNEMAFQMEAMASDATALLPLLKDGGAVMSQLGDEAERTGRILSEIDVARLQLAAQQMAEFDQTIGTLKNQLGAELAPILAGIGKLIEEAAIEAGGFGNLVGDAMNTGIEATGFMADAIHGIEVVFKTVANGLILGFTKIGEMAAKAGGPMLALADALPGIDMSMQLEQMAQFQTEMVAVGKLAKQAIFDALNEPLPSEGLKKWVGEVQAAADEAAMSMNERLAESMGGEGLEVFSEEEGKKKDIEEEKKRQEKLKQLREQQKQQRLMQLADENARRMELFNQRYFGEEELRKEFEERQAELDAARREQGLINEQEYQQARLQNMRDMFSQQLGIQSSGYDALGNIAAKHWNAETAMAIDALGAIVNATAGNSRKMFEAQKALGIANATISTFTGMAKALELGWPLGPIAAASIAANGFAKVAAIRSQSFGSGGGGSAGGSAGAAGSGGFSAPAQTPGVGIQGQQQQTQQFNISLADEGMFSGRQVRQLIGQINDQTQNNGVVLVTGG